MLRTSDCKHNAAVIERGLSDSAGTDVALETADVAPMADDSERLVYALQLAKQYQSVLKQNLTLSIVVISILVVGAVGV